MCYIQSNYHSLATLLWNELAYQARGTYVAEATRANDVSSIEATPRSKHTLREITFHHLIQAQKFLRRLTWLQNGGVIQTQLRAAREE